MNLPVIAKKTIFFFASPLIANRFLAGETIEDAVLRAKSLQQRGEKAVINILGEHLKDYREVYEFLDQYCRLLEKIKESGLDINIAVKPSQLGLDVSNGWCKSGKMSRERWYELNLSCLLRKTESLLPTALVEIDAEDHYYRKAVFNTTVFLSGTYSNQRLACQANLETTPQEIQFLLNRRISVRLCKGDCYPGDIKNQNNIRKRYIELAKMIIKNGYRSAIATHDPSIIEEITDSGLGACKERFEIEMLMGIENGLSLELIEKGFSVRRYVPCGPNWRPYGERRLDSVAKILLRNWLYRRKKQFNAIFR